MLLSILIPTYNRSKFLLRNLELLSILIKAVEKKDLIEIIISNNNSSDTTDIEVTEFIKINKELNINYFLQNKNIGLESNALFVLEKSNAEYVMYLGDDDFLNIDYFKEIIKHIINNKDTFCIIPNIIGIDVRGNSMKGYFGRDDNISSQIYKAGFKNCFVNSWRGHQLSGLVLKRDNLYKEYIKFGLSNIYLFIFFVAYSCLKGNTYHLTNYPVKVTQTDQSNKDWSYGDDGLMNEVLDNYKKLPINTFKATLLQLYFYYRQSWRLFVYLEKGNQFFLKAFKKIWLSKNTTFLFQLLFPFIVVLQIFKLMIKKI